MTNKNFHLVKIITFVAFLIGLSSCGIWENFTVYFNTYYNASTLFNQVESDIQKAIKDPFEFKLLPITNQQKQDLTKVIEKCSKILQFNKESSYFQDALFIIGKAFYYQGEFAKAQRKFLELSSVKENNYLLDNQLWLAKTQLQLRNFDEGLALIDSTIASALKENDRKIYTEASIERISFLIYRERYDEAAETAKEYLKNSKDDEMNALVAYQLGVIYEKIKNYDKAAEAFSLVENYSPTFDVEFNSKFEHAQLLIQLNKLDESLSELENLKNDNKFKNFLDRINLAIGELYYDQNKIDKALQILTSVDSTYSKTEYGGQASYDIAKIYEFKIANYDSAKKYYAKTTSSLAKRELKDTSTVKVVLFNKYFGIRDNIRNFTDQLRYINDPIAYERDSIDYYLTARKLMELQDEEQQRIQSQRQFPQQMGNVVNNPDLSETQLKTLEAQKLQAAINWAQQKLQSNPTPDILEVVKKGRLIKPVKPAISKDSVNALLCKNYYDLGNLFFTEFNLPDSAFYYYQKIIDNPNNKTIIDKAYYAIASYYEIENKKELADSIYTIIYNQFEKSPLHSEVAKKLGKVKVESSTDPAEKLFIEAEKKYFDKKYASAINDYYNIYLEYPKSAFAPKSLLAIGMIYEDALAKNDSAAAIYDTLVKKYSITDYARTVQAKLQEYEKETKLKEAEKQKPKQDSLQSSASNSASDSLKNQQSKSINDKKLPIEEKDSRQKPEIDSSIVSQKESLKDEPKQEIKNLIKYDTSKTKKDTLKEAIENKSKVDTTKKKNFFYRK
ncbi:tetratricopeptide repeat protein [Melioribacteraceae bacterium 4301-Me]|uniref:tetratricopeptide repeat protein n=1 Tax=Pyranulibacter aquaticus TaxID=3163344 RepID=UPI003597C7A5